MWGGGEKGNRERLHAFWLVPPASYDRNFLAGQGLVHSNRKIASQLSPVLMAIGPSSKLERDRTGAEVGYVNVRRWLFCYARMSSGSTFQQCNYALGIGASGHVDGDFDRARAIREGPVSHLTRLSDPFGTMTSEPSAVRMTLARMPIRLTSPTLPPTSMTSPT